MHTLTLQQAQQIVIAALNHARSAGSRPMAVVVVDAAGHIKLSVREDGATVLRLDIALGKAGAAIGMGVNTRVLAARAQELPVFFGALSASSSQKFIPHTGAVVIKDADGTVLGAVGASGGTGDEDEALCIAGVLAIGLNHG